MHGGFQKAKRAAIAAYLIAVHLILAYFVGGWLVQKYVVIEPVANSIVPAPVGQQSIPTPLPVPEEFADQNIANANIQAPPPATSSGGGLIIPVVGVKPEQLNDTFSSSRSENRFHDAIDIPAALGTPVVAAADGEIARFWDSDRGGITIYQLTTDRKFVLYYAHLQRRADEIREGMTVKQGATIAYVGDTGNAGAGNYHLHFSIARVTDPKRIWHGTYLNPFPYLKNGSYPDMP
jgi:murein DD-endopeptidase MepM/ murein hydrolase activator NlpD